MHARRIVAIVALLAASTAGLAACDPNTTAKSSATSSVASQTATDSGTAVPNFVGMGLQAAQDAAQAAGFNDLHSHDASDQGRHQIWDRDWTVCDQTPAAGSNASKDVKIDMGAVKTDETCPSASASPTATPSPTPTTASPTPTPKPKPKPKPRPTVTHHTTVHHTPTSGGTSGGSSTGGGSSTHTDPPVDNHGGATALCNDGTLSYSAHHRGTCSHHGGVAVFYN